MERTPPVFSKDPEVRKLSEDYDYSDGQVSDMGEDQWQSADQFFAQQPKSTLFLTPLQSLFKTLPFQLLSITSFSRSLAGT